MDNNKAIDSNEMMTDIEILKMVVKILLNAIYAMSMLTILYFLSVNLFLIGFIITMLYVLYEVIAY